LKQLAFDTEMQNARYEKDEYEAACVEKGMRSQSLNPFSSLKE
jgi:hypothetical protein